MFVWVGRRKIVPIVGRQQMNVMGVGFDYTIVVGG
jgi:hypothetical protein